MSSPSVIVLFGGASSERRVSVASARNVVAAIDGPRPWFVTSEGRVHEVDATELSAHTRPFEEDFVPRRAPLATSLHAALDLVGGDDVLFLAFHGGEGENGVIQAELEARGLAFTGSGSKASAAAFDKARAKEIVSAAGVRVAPAAIVSGSESVVTTALSALLAEHGRVVVKPVADGSSTGLHHLAAAAQLDEVAAAVSASGVPYLVEPFVTGTELTIGVVDSDEGPIALCASEVRLDPGRAFDFQGKYLGRGTQELTPAEVAPEIATEARRVAVAAHRALGCEGYTRTDVIAGTHGITFLETNTLPGLTSASFIPQQLAHAGRSLRDFVADQLAHGRARRARLAR
ncbi:MAG: ATP-grasp domain-containing protein [Sandaracinaceae bacterium]|nr:ATP-grasp domain-containing protein [Sandaracinaceae bacterium]